MATSSPWAASSLESGPRLRLALASALCLPAAASLQVFGGTSYIALALPSILLAASAVLLQRASIGAHLLARSALWSNLLLGFLLATFSPSHRENLAGLAMGVACGLALVVAGRIGLGADAPGAFRPVAFRRTLALAMVLAVADAQALALFGALGLEERRSAGDVGLVLAGAALLSLAIVGLYRLRAWGLVLGAFAAAAIAACAFGGAFGLVKELRFMLGMSAVLQLALAVPVFVAIARRRAPPPRPASRLDALAIPVVVVGLLGVAAVATLTR
jgi:hypothetical protein